MTEVEQVIRWVLDQNQAEITALEDALGRGQARDYSNYMYTCGQIFGLKKLNGDLIEKLTQYQRGEME